MKLVYKICLVNVLIAIVASCIFLFPDFKRTTSDITLGFGLAGIFFGVLSFLIALVLLLSKKKSWGQGFLLSAGVLFLLGTITCSTLL